MSKSEDMWDWSPRHIRIRYELFLSAITVFVIGYFDVVKFKLSPFEFENMQAQELEYYALIAATCAYIFLSVTFCYRSYYEFLGKDKILKSVKAELDLISEGSNAINNPKLKGILQNVSSLKTFFDGKKKGDDELAGEINKLTTEVSKLVELIGKLPNDSREAVLEYLGDEVPDELSSSTYYESSLSALLINYHEKRYKYVDRESNIQAEKDAISSLAHSFTEINEGVLSHVIDNFDNNAKVVSKLRSDVLGKLSAPIKFQQYGMSLFIPYIITLVIFALGWLKQTSLI